MNRRKIKIIAVLLALFMLMPLFLACGGDDGANTPTEPAVANGDDNNGANADANANETPGEDSTPEPAPAQPDPTDEPEPTEPPTETPPPQLAAAEEPPYASMIALYNMEGELKNSVGGASGTLWNGASFIDDSDRGGKVLYLNNDDITEPGNGAGYQAEGQWAELAAPYIPDSDQMTISMWFKVKDELRTWARAIDMSDKRAQTLMADGESGVLAPNRFINISPTNGSNTIGTFNCNDNADLDLERNRDRVFADQVNENQWVHAVLVINGPGSGKANVLYLNGIAKESTGGGDEWADADEAILSPKHILASEFGVNNAFVGRSAHEQNGDQVFNGYIDDVAIFNTALTAGQVTGLMEADLKNR